MSRPPLLLADIGGTNARFALDRDGEIEQIATLLVADYPTAAAALAAVLQELPADARPRAAAFACAGPVIEGAVSLTNSPWRLEALELERRFALERVLLVNDLAAVAWAVPHFRTDQLRAVGGGTPQTEQPSVVIGPGTGLGVAAFLPPPGPRVISGEGGHATLAAADDREAEVLSRLRAELGHVSAERLLSGDGLIRLYETISAIDGTTAGPRTPAEISDAALAGRCPACRQALDMFCAMLGTFAGNLALTWGAKGGVYISGGIVPQIASDFAASGFRGRFEAKGRFRPYLAAIPTYLVLHPEPAFLGLSRLMAAAS